MKPILDMPSLLYITTNFSEQSNAMSQGNFFGLFLRSDQITLKMIPYWLRHHDCLLHTKVTNPESGCKEHGKRFSYDHNTLVAMFTRSRQS